MTAPRPEWWLIVRLGGVPHCWQVGELGDDTSTRDLIDRARVVVGFPAGDGWVADGRGDTVQLTCGEPHPQLMAQATVHRLSELDAVSVETLASYRAACDVEHRQACVRLARESLARLTPDERAQVIGEIPPRPTGGTR